MDTNENDALKPQESPQEEPATRLSSNKQQDAQTRLSKPKKKGGRAWLIAAIALLVAAAIGAGVYYFTNQKDSRHHTDADEDEEDTEIMDEDDEDEDEDDYVIGREDEDEDDEGSPSVEPDPNAPQPLNLTGDADGYPLTLTLEVSADGRVRGTYKNDGEEPPIQVSGTKSGDAIHLTGAANNTTYTFRIRPEGRLYTGIVETSSGKSMELHLTAK